MVQQNQGFDYIALGKEGLVLSAGCDYWMDTVLKMEQIPLLLMENCMCKLSLSRVKFVLNISRVFHLVRKIMFPPGNTETVGSGPQVKWWLMSNQQVQRTPLASAISLFSLL